MIYYKKTCGKFMIYYIDGKYYTDCRHSCYNLIHNPVERSIALLGRYLTRTRDI